MCPMSIDTNSGPLPPQQAFRPKRAMRADRGADFSKARSAVLAEWDSWSEINPGSTAGHAVRFYAHLVRQRPDLLDFRYSTADKLQLIRSWLLTAGRISDQL